MKLNFSELFFTHIQAMCLGFLLSQPWTYIRIILRAVIRLLHLLLQAYYDRRQFSLVHHSLEETAVFVRRRVLWPMSFLIFIVWMNWRTFQPTSFSSWCVSHVFGFVHRLVSHVLGAVHWKQEIVTTLQVQLCIGVRVQM